MALIQIMIPCAASVPSIALQALLPVMATWLKGWLCSSDAVQWAWQLRAESGRTALFDGSSLADQDSNRAAAAAEVCGDKAAPAKLDLSDDGTLEQALDDVDLVVNTLSMPVAGALPLLRSVLEAGVSYVDASSDPEALQAIFDSEYLDALAGYRAVSAVPGLGASPGLTNALTNYLGQRLERIDDASFYLVDDPARSNFQQWRGRLSAFGDPALVWRDNEWQHVSPFSEYVDVSFPSPLGNVRCSAVGLGSGNPAGQYRIACKCFELSRFRGSRGAGNRQEPGGLWICK